MDDDDDHTVVVAWTVYSKGDTVQKYKKKFQVDNLVKEMFNHTIEHEKEKIVAKNMLTKLTSLTGSNKKSEAPVNKNLEYKK